MDTTLFNQIQFGRLYSNSASSLSPAFVRAIVIAFVAACFGPAVHCKATTFLETAALGRTGQTGGVSLASDQFIGVRFEVTASTTTSEIGGHFYTYSSSQIFGAIVALTDISDFPDSFDLSTTDVVGTALLSCPTTSADCSVPLTADLSVGHYALVFGTGLFGATGGGAAAQDNSPLGTHSWFFSRDTPQLAWRDTSLDDLRFFITAVPEPSITGLLATAALGSIAFRRSRRRVGGLCHEQTQAPLLRIIVLHRLAFKSIRPARRVQLLGA